MTRSLRLVSTNPAPAVGPMAKPKVEAPKPKPLISSEARRKEQEGASFYPRVHLRPQELPSMYLALTAFPRRVERKTWRTPVAVVIGVFVGLAALGIGAGVWALLIGAAAGAACALSDGWSR